MNKAHPELHCWEWSDLSRVPQCQSAVHEGHEGKRMIPFLIGFTCLTKIMAMTLLMIFKNSRNSSQRWGPRRSCPPQPSWRGMRKRQTMSRISTASKISKLSCCNSKSIWAWSPFAPPGSYGIKQWTVFIPIPSLSNITSQLDLRKEDETNSVPKSFLMNLQSNMRTVSKDKATRQN